MSLPSWAVKGRKVVYVGYDGAPTATDLGFKLDWRPKAKAIYTIRDTMVMGYVRLVEHRVSGFWPEGQPFSDAWCDVRGFRPVHTIESDLSEHFVRLLDVPATHERERA